MVEYTSMNLLGNQKTGKDKDTLKIPLGEQGGITALELRLTATNYSDGNASNGILNTIREVRITHDGQQSPLRVTGTELYKLAVLRDREAPELSESADADAVQSVRIPILLGRTPDDQLYGLDLSKHADWMLEIDYDLTIVRACGSTGYVSGSFTVNLDATITKGLAKPAYVGMICPREMYIKSSTTVQLDRVHINGASKLVGLYIYAYKSGVSDGSLVSNVKMMGPVPADVIVDRGFTDLQYARRTMAGSTTTSWAPVWMARGRLNGEQLQPLGKDAVDIELNTLDSAGEVRLVGEFLER